MTLSTLKFVLINVVAAAAIAYFVAGPLMLDYMNAQTRCWHDSRGNYGPEYCCCFSSDALPSLNCTVLHYSLDVLFFIPVSVSMILDVMNLPAGFLFLLGSTGVVAALMMACANGVACWFSTHGRKWACWVFAIIAVALIVPMYAAGPVIVHVLYN